MFRYSPSLCLLNISKFLIVEIVALLMNHDDSFIVIYANKEIQCLLQLPKPCIAHVFMAKDQDIEFTIFIG